MADSTNEVLLIFVKNPEKGKVKTRLARTIGDQEALAVYKKLLKTTKSVADPLQVTKQVWYSAYIGEQDMWSKGSYQKKLQAGRDLGERMKNAFRKAFDKQFGKVVIIGSDCAAISSEIIQQAFDALDNHQTVVGPSEDGGYYLLGMAECYPELFDVQEWSTDSVLEETLNQAQNMGLSLKLLPELNDIDTEEDLRASRMDMTKNDRECNAL
jgi:rSAM/selenodomain-associated transferase 1